jgi:predicted phosphodiesterase
MRVMRGVLWTAWALLLLAGTPGPAGAGEPGRHEDCLFSFAAIADSHIRIITSDDFRYLKAQSISRELLANFVRDIKHHIPPVDFAVHLGDITETGTAQEFSWASLILDSLTCPLYPVVGNHDNFQGDSKQNWLDFAGLDSTHYSFDYFGINFIVIDCTLPRYIPPYVHCDALVRARVARELALKPHMPAIILSHYNMWERPWNAEFDTTESYAEYMGVPWLREVLEDAGNVIAVINGHVHANRAEVHNGIHYLDVNATLTGRPSIRYFYVYRDRIEVDYEYISDQSLFNHVQDLCPWCVFCFDPDSVCAFIDGAETDKRFTIYYERAPAGAPEPTGPAFHFVVYGDQSGGSAATVTSPHTGTVLLSVYDVTGRRIDNCRIYKAEEHLRVDLNREMPEMAGLSAGIYFVSAAFRGGACTRKLTIIR